METDIKSPSYFVSSSSSTSSSFDDSSTSDSYYSLPTSVSSSSNTNQRNNGFGIPDNLIPYKLAGQNHVVIRGVHFVVHRRFGPSSAQNFGEDAAFATLPFQSEFTAHPLQWSKDGVSPTYVPDLSKTPSGETYQSISQENLKAWYADSLSDDFGIGDILGEPDEHFKSSCFTIDVSSSYSPATPEELFDILEKKESLQGLDNLKASLQKLSSKTSTAAFVSFLKILRQANFREGVDYDIARDETRIKSERPNSVIAIDGAIENFLSMEYGDYNCLDIGKPSQRVSHLFVEVIGFASVDDLKKSQHDLEFIESRYRAWQSWMFRVGTFLYGPRAYPFQSLNQLTSYLESPDLRSQRSKLTASTTYSQREDMTQGRSSRRPRIATRPSSRALDVFGFYTIQQYGVLPMYTTSAVKVYAAGGKIIESLFGQIQPVSLQLRTSDRYSKLKPLFASELNILESLKTDESLEAVSIKNSWTINYRNNEVLTSVPPWSVQYSALPNNLLYGEYFHFDQFAFGPKESQSLGNGSFGAVVKTKWKASRTSLFTSGGKLKGMSKHAFNHHHLILDTLRERRDFMRMVENLRSRGVNVDELYKKSLSYMPIQSLLLTIIEESEENGRSITERRISFTSHTSSSVYDEAIGYVTMAVCRDCMRDDGKIDAVTSKMTGVEEMDVTNLNFVKTAVVAYDTAVSVDVALKMTNFKPRNMRREYCIIKSLFERSKVAKYPVKMFDLSSDNSDLYRQVQGTPSVSRRVVGGSTISSWGIMTVQDQKNVGNMFFALFSTPILNPTERNVLLKIKLSTLLFNLEKGLLIEPKLSQLSPHSINKPYGLGYDGNVIFTVIPYRINGDLDSILNQSLLEIDVGQELDVPTTLLEVESRQAFFKSILNSTPRPLSLYEFLSIMHDVAVALNMMNSSGVMHGDLKEPNILVGSKMEGYVTDFTFSSPHGVLTGMLGTRGYTPRGLGFSTESSLLTDMYMPVDTYVDAVAFSTILEKFCDEFDDGGENTIELSFLGCCYNASMVQKAIGGLVPAIFEDGDYDCFNSPKIRYIKSSKIPVSMTQIPVRLVKSILDDIIALSELIASDYIGPNTESGERKAAEAKRQLSDPMRKFVTDFGSRELLQNGCNRFFIAEVVLKYLMDTIVAESRANWGDDVVVVGI